MVEFYTLALCNNIPQMQILSAKLKRGQSSLTWPSFHSTLIVEQVLNAGLCLDVALWENSRNRVNVSFSHDVRKLNFQHSTAQAYVLLTQSFGQILTSLSLIKYSWPLLTEGHLGYTLRDGNIHEFNLATGPRLAILMELINDDV